MDYEGIEQAIKAEIGSGPDATEIMKYIEDCPQPADGWTELVVMAGDDDKSIYSERFGNLIFNWKDAIVDGVPAILDILNPNVLLAIVKIGRAYRTLVNLFHVDLGEDEAKVVRALWLDMRAVVRGADGGAGELEWLAAAARRGCGTQPGAPEGGFPVGAGHDPASRLDPRASSARPHPERLNQRRSPLSRAW